MRLGFHYHIPFFQDNEGNIKTPGYLGRFLDSIAFYCENLTCFMHSPGTDEVNQMDYILQSKNIDWIDIGPHASVPIRTLRSQQYSKPVKQYLQKLDALLIRGPSPLLPAMARAAGDLPVALLLVGDYLAGIDDLPQPRWRKEAIRIWAYWNYHEQFAVSKRALTFVNSHKLYQQLQGKVRELVETRTTTLSQNDFFERDDTCHQRPVKLLYTGRMDRAKGLFEMVEAVEWLLKKDYDVVLDLVGWPQKGDQIVEELIENVSKRGLSERIIYHGFKSVGEELFAYYKQADIYIIASQTSEGFPRTIWEAMAHSLPVVATSVGSIPYFLSHKETAYLVESKNVQAFVEGIEMIIKHTDFRRKLISNAREIARRNTLENLSYDMISMINAWIDKNEKNT